MNPLIYGKNDLSHVTSIEVGDNTAEIFREIDGVVSSVTVPASHYMLFTEQHSPKFKRLTGNQPYRWLYEADSREKWSEVLKASYQKRFDFHVIREPSEALMIREGYTSFKQMQVKDVSVLSFDIETTGLVHNKDSCVLLISNTFRRQGKIVRRLFSADEYKTPGEMIATWAEWVCEMNPSVLVGHNIFSFDIPYLQFCAGEPIYLGRNDSPLQIANRTSQYRKDGSQSYDYNNVRVYGREIVDTFFLSMKYDIGRNYESYGLKAIVKHEGLEREGREHYDASKIKDNWHDESERQKIKTYAIDDADDSLKLFDLMIPSLFYYAQSAPRTLQALVNSATGSQINGMMVRAYLQQGHSIAKGSPAEEYEGAISFGVPGIHKNVFKIDVASMYPSIMRSFQIYNPEKDPQKLFLQIVEFFTLARLEYKAKAKAGDAYYMGLDAAAKLTINSSYGFLGAPKLNYNFPEGAAAVTRHGREILKQTIKHISGKEYVA